MLLRTSRPGAWVRGGLSLVARPEAAAQLSCTAVPGRPWAWTPMRVRGGRQAQPRHTAPCPPGKGFGEGPRPPELCPCRGEQRLPPLKTPRIPTEKPDLSQAPPRPPTCPGSAHLRGPFARQTADQAWRVGQREAGSQAWPGRLPSSSSEAAAAPPPPRGSLAVPTASPHPRPGGTPAPAPGP